jgi:hypothetical protein
MTSGVGTATAEFRDTPLVSCLTSLLQGMSFPAQATPQPVDFPFKF